MDRVPVSYLPPPMMRRLVWPLIALVSLTVLTACDDAPATAPAEAASPAPTPPAATVRPVPGCLFRLHAKLLPEDPHGVLTPPRFAGFFRIRLTGDGEDEGEVRYATSLSVPAVDEGFDRIFAEIRARIPANTPEWTDHNKSDPGGIAGAGIRVVGAAPIDPHLAAALVSSPSDFVTSVTVERGDDSESFTGVIEPDRGSSATVRQGPIRSCFGV